MEDNRFKKAVRRMLLEDENGRTEFDKIYDYVARIEKKKVAQDTEFCRDLINVNGTTTPLITHLKSPEVLRNIITFMNMEE